MAKLSDVLKTRYQAWRNDVPAGWLAPLTGIEPDFAGVPKATTLQASVPIFPRLKADPIAGAPPGACVLRCLDRVAFSNVRVVVMGQDPYPRRRQATGRAFEQGSWVSWGATSDRDKVPASFRRVIQRLVQFRTNLNTYAASNGFTKVLAALAANTIALDAPSDLYDAWENEGAIFLNKVLTYTLPAHVKTHHGVFWLPVVSRIVERLAERTTDQVVFAMWGAEPAKLQPLIQAAAMAAGTWNTRVKVLAGTHPARSAFLSGTNPFKQINDSLASMGGAPLNW